MRRKKCLATLTMAAMVAASLAGCSSSGEKTVSYTHLDVYKRQLIQRLEVLSSVGIERNSDTDRDRSGQGAGLEELCSLVL